MLSAIDTTSLQALPAGLPLGLPSGLSASASRAHIAAAAKDFEAVFMSQMLKPMWAGVETDPVFGGGAGEDVMRDMLIQEYGKSMAEADHYGLADAVMKEMISLQEKSENKGAVHAKN